MPDATNYNGQCLNVIRAARYSLDVLPYEARVSQMQQEIAMGTNTMVHRAYSVKVHRQDLIRVHTVETRKDTQAANSMPSHPDRSVRAKARR